MGQCATERISVTGESANLRIQAAILRKSGKYTEALAMYQRAIESNYYNFRAIEGLGTTYMRMQSYREAQQWCVKTLKQYPDLDKARYIQGTLALLEDDYKKAIEQFQLVTLKSVKIPEYYVWTQYFVAYCYWRLKQYPKALRYVELAIRHFQSQYGQMYLDCHYLKGAIYMENKQIQEATDVLILAIELQENSYTQLPIKKKQRKLKYIKECLQIIVKSECESPSFKFNYMRAYFLRALGKNNEAFNHLGKALETEPDNINGCLLDSYLTNGQEQLEVLERILELDPKHKEALFRKGLYHYNINEFENSISFSEQSLEQDNHFVQAHLLLQASYIAIGRLDNVDINYDCKSPFINIQKLSLMFQEFKLKQQQVQQKYVTKTYSKLRILIEQVLEWHEKPSLNFELPDDVPVNYLAIKPIMDPFLRELIQFCSEIQ